jgi:lipopolysaccharide biosynthesis glycosyltransferase
MNLRIYVGHDSREQAAFDVACKTARQFGCDVIPLYEDRLRASGMLMRPLDRRGGMYDLNSNAAQATDFAIARFFVPLLAHDGWALFVDCDVVFLRDPHQLMRYVSGEKACFVVKHQIAVANAMKMDGQTQSIYPRKLWSSVCMWNAGHPALQRLNLTTLNQWPGRDLHAFKFLADDEIGALPPEWNHLVGINPARSDAAILHFTEGTPDMPGYENCEHADVWRKVSQR